MPLILDNLAKFSIPLQLLLDTLEWHERKNLQANEKLGNYTCSWDVSLLKEKRYLGDASSKGSLADPTIFIHAQELIVLGQLGIPGVKFAYIWIEISV